MNTNFVIVQTLILLIFVITIGIYMISFRLEGNMFRLSPRVMKQRSGSKLFLSAILEYED